MREFIEGVWLILLFTTPAFVLPLILGPIILRFFREDELSRMAGWFSMKPLLATPLWVLTITLGQRAHLSEGLFPVLGLIPGIGLTVWIVWRYHHLLRTETGTVILLLVGDALRWLNSFAWLTLDSSVGSPFYTAGLILPNAYAAMGLVIAWLRHRQLLKAAQARI